MDKGLLDDFIKQINDQKSPMNGLLNISSKMEELADHLKYIQQGLMALSDESNRLGLSIRLIIEELIEAEIITKEEFSKKYEEKVVKPLLQERQRIKEEVDRMYGDSKQQDQE